MNFIAWLKNPGFRGYILPKLYDEDPEIARQALDDIRAEGWLSDGSLRGVDLREANLPYANLEGADLEDANLTEADLSEANFEGANLLNVDFSEASLAKSNLKNALLSGAVFAETELTGADFTGADLRGATFDAANLTDAVIAPEQLAVCKMLYRTTMPDGSTYDGRYDLDGDLDFAEEEAYAEDDPERMAEFYNITLDEYERGIAWAAESLDALLVKTKAAEEDEDLDEEEEFDEEYDPSLPIDYFDLVIAAFEHPASLKELRKSPEMRDRLREMGAWAAAVLLFFPALLINLFYLILSVIPGPHNFMFGLVRNAFRFNSPILENLFVVGTLLLNIALIFAAFFVVQRRFAAATGKVDVFSALIIFLGAANLGSGYYRAPLFLCALIAAYVTLHAVGTARSRRLLWTIATLALIGGTPLRLLWSNWLEVMAIDLWPRSWINFIAEPPGMVIYSWLNLAWAVIESIIFVQLIRAAVQNWVMPRLGTKGAGIFAIVLVMIVLIGGLALTAMSQIVPAVMAYIN